MSVPDPLALSFPALAASAMTPLTVNVAPPSTVMALLAEPSAYGRVELMLFPPCTSSVPALIVAVLLAAPRLVALLICTVPPLIVTPPPKLLLVSSASVVFPLLVKVVASPAIEPEPWMV